MIINRKARFNYTINEKFEAGIKLLGTEVKSLRDHHGDFSDSYVFIENDEVFLIGFSIPKYWKATLNNHEEKRTRKLLLRKREIIKIKKIVKEKRMTIVPLRLYIKDKYFKMEIGIAQGKNTYDKKQAIKERDIKRQTKRELNA